MRHETVNTYWVKIFMAGDYAVASQALRKYCFEKGLCVTIDKTNYIYTGGEEEGFVVGLINYPRFPKKPDELFGIAYDVAILLKDVCCQHSFTLMAPDKTVWVTTRKESL